MKHTELRAAVLDALEKHDTGATFFDGRPAVFDEEDAKWHLNRSQFGIRIDHDLASISDHS
ncbi:phage tail terminator protein, partial [Escherichia coli]|nr:phage tail terminator protein [Escherichia coli]